MELDRNNHMPETLLRLAFVLFLDDIQFYSQADENQSPHQDDPWEQWYEDYQYF